MTKIYAELVISCEKKNIVNDLNYLTNLTPFQPGCVDIGNLTRQGTISTKSIWIYNTTIIETPYIEEVSTIFCADIAPIASLISSYVKKNGCYLYIYFVIKLDDEGVFIRVNKEMINLAKILDCEINFDGL